MRDLRRFYPPDREVLRGINLSFYPGAKIGVIGANGSGKSSLLRIMAGLDDGFTGEARLTPGFSVGYLSQEPQLDPTKDVVGNVADGVAEQRDLLARFNEVCAALAIPTRTSTSCSVNRPNLQTKIDAANAWDLERKLDIAMDALRLPPRRRRHQALGWRAPSRGALSAPALDAGLVCCSTSRRITWTPSRSRGSSERCRTTPAPWSRSPTIVTSWTTRRRGYWNSTAVTVSPGRATTRRGWSRSRLDWRPKRSPTRFVKRRSSANSNGSACRRELVRARARPGSMRSTSWWPSPKRRTSRRQIGDRHPARTATRRRRRERATAVQGLRRATADRGPHVPAAAGRHRRASSAPTAPARRRCSR
jgi:energy-coupling factor transporter ATP-binding protein EcfA2